MQSAFRRRHGHPSRRPDCRGYRRRGPCRCDAAVVCHVCADQVPGSEGRAETELSRENGGRDDPGEHSCIVSWRRGVRAADAKEIQHRRLAFKDGSAADGADFDTGHRHGDLEVAIVADWLAYVDHSSG